MAPFGREEGWGRVRDKALRYGLVQCGKIEEAEDPKKVYETYYEFEFRVDRVKPYQILAINRGEAEKVLRVQIDVAERDWQQPIQNAFRSDPRVRSCDYGNQLFRRGHDHPPPRRRTRRGNYHRRFVADDGRHRRNRRPFRMVSGCCVDGLGLSRASSSRPFQAAWAAAMKQSLRLAQCG